MKKIFDKIPQSIKEAAKEAARLIIMAVVSWAIVYLTKAPQTEGTLAGLFILRIVDKWLHEHGKATDNKSLIGLIGF